MYTETTVTSEVVYEGKIVDVKRDLAELHTGKRVLREVVKHPGGVVILPVDSNGGAYMVRQFRYPPQKPLLEVCAGKLEPGEDPKSAAIRELREETGFTAAEVVELGYSYPSPGYCDEVNYHYLALGLTAGKIALDADEYVDTERYSLERLLDMACSGEINDGKTIVTLLRASRFLRAC
ncbi:MAG: NUDIX hydrolase [Oscillospiraceae bacterium]|jgi:ADP-ribose pyrophosphatase|nr:NUDIX hydrolase [Oscillospiraceae bacterium]